MLDSSTKLPDGILAGNTFQMGHFDECISVGVILPESNRKLKGQYCLAEIEYSPRDFEAHSSLDTTNEIDLFNASTWDHIKVSNPIIVKGYNQENKFLNERLKHFESVPRQVSKNCNELLRK